MAQVIADDDDVILDAGRSGRGTIRLRVAGQDLASIDHNGNGGGLFSGSIPVPADMAFVAGEAPLTRRATMCLSGDGDWNATPGTLADYAMRFGILLPNSTVRWRLRVRNWNCFTGTLYGGPLNFTGAWVGTPSFSSSVHSWPAQGTFTAAPTQALPSFVVDATGDEYVSAWVTDPTLQFAEMVAAGLSVGWTNPTNANMPISYSGCCWADGTSGSTAAASAGSVSLAGGTGGTTGFDVGYVDVKLEYEYVGTKKICLVVGDSIACGNIDVDGSGTNQAYFPGKINGLWEQLGLKMGFHCVNLAVGGTTAAAWAAAGTPPNGVWSRVDLATCKPDFAVLALGTNDLFTLSPPTLNAWIASMQTIINNIRAIGIKPVYVTTIMPRGFGLARTVTDGATTSGSPTVTSPSNNFTNIGTGSTISGPGIPANTYVGVITSAGSIGLSSSATANVPVNATATASGVTLTIGQDPRETNRQTFNTAIRRCPWGITGVIDTAQLVEVPGATNTFNPYYLLTQPHPTGGGYAAIGGLLALPALPI